MSQRRGRSHRDHQQERLLLLGAGALIVIVALILGAGWEYDNVYLANQTVATVYGQPITLRQLADASKEQAKIATAQAGGNASDPTIASQLDQEKRAIPGQELQTLVQQAIIAHEAQQRGITVTDADVTQEEQQEIAQFWASTHPSPTPDTSATSTDVTPGADATPGTDATPATAASSGTDVTPGAQATAGADVSPTPDTTAATAPGATATPLPTLEPSTYQQALQQALGPSGMTEAQVRDEIYQQLLQQKVQQAIAADVPTTQPEVHARHIVVADQQSAQAALDRIKNGEDFAAVASDVSTDTATKAQGGDMGWFPRGIEPAAVEEVAFSLQPGQLSDVFQSTDGWQVLQVLETDPNRQVDPTQLQTLQSKAYSDWLTKAQQDPQVQQQGLQTDQQNWVLRQIGVRP